MFSSEIIPKLLCLFSLVLLFNDASALVLRAYLSQHGLHGELEFSQKNDLISIRTNLQPTLQYPDQVWKWAIHQFPVDYRDISEGRCSEEYLGKEIIDLTEEIGYLIIPGKERAEFESKNNLTGDNGLWGKSIVLKTAEHDRVICASILATEEKYEKFAVARFDSPVAGTLNFRWLHVQESNIIDAYLHVDLYHTKSASKDQEFTEHKWKLFVTDIFETNKEDVENCDILQQVFDPDSSGDGKSVGDLDVQLGKIKVATDGVKNKKKVLYKHQVIDVLRNEMQTTKRSLYVVLYDNRHEDHFLACAKLILMEPKSAKVLINMDGIKGFVNFTQRSPFDPTWSTFDLGASDKEYVSNLKFASSVTKFIIRDLPPRLTDGRKVHEICNTTGEIYNPMDLNLNAVPPSGLSTQDHYPIGDLLGKYKGRTEYLTHKYLLPGLADELSGAYWDVFLPLQGVRSVMHRSLVIERRSTFPICGTLAQYELSSGYQTQMFSAEVAFRYPIVGRVIFRQPLEQPWDDTTIIIESMVHADGANVNNTREHRWAIHANPPGADYYNWTQRCVSAGPVYSPFGEIKQHEECRGGLEGICLVGDFTIRHGMLNVAGRKRDSLALTRRLFTDTIVGLAGRRSIMKKSLVIFDDHGPVARGERMACSIVNGLHRRKAVIRDWFGNEEMIALNGRVELTQQSEYDVTNVVVQLEDLVDGLKDYKIHEAPVERGLEFPCEKTTLYDTYNPYNVDKALSPPPTLGTADQYELGDFGIKYGQIEGKKIFDKFFNETQMSLYGPYSVLGRSMALHRKSKNRRWACSSIERGYSPSEGRELRAIVSFHHPLGFAYGYIRMTQLIHSDGSASDTVIETNVRYPGLRDRNMTRNHNWEIWVNPVGVDATVTVTGVRCVAGGYRWNPYFTQLADPLNRDLYEQECGVDNPLRCDVGDLTSRLGTIEMGGKRQVFVDSNFPLEGKVSAVGRSIVIFGPGRSHERLACANIEPDYDIVKYMNVMKPPRFVLSNFLDQIRGVMGIPPWMLGVDSRKTKVLYQGTCIQILLHFTGPNAAKLEQDFTRLLTTGKLESPSIFIPGVVVSQKRKKTISYRQCGVTDPHEKKKSSFFFSRPSGSPVVSTSKTVLLVSLAHLVIRLLL